MAMMSYVHEIYMVCYVVQNPQVVLLSGKGSARMVSVRGSKRSACCCLKGARPVIAPLLQAKQTLLALSTWPAHQPVPLRQAITKLHAAD